MNIGEGSDYVGAWTYHLPESEPLRDPATEWQRLARVAGAAVNSLCERALLQFPLTFTCETWQPGHAPHITTAVAATPEGALQRFEELRGYTRWGTLGISGKTLVEAATDERALDGVLGVSVAAESFGSSISVWTLSDVWLLYDLNGRPQPIVSSFNAPRLESALEEIERVVGVAAVGEDTRFAHRDGYTLRNRRVHGNVHGEVLDLQDMGYDESWIVERWPEPE